MGLHFITSLIIVAGLASVPKVNSGTNRDGAQKVVVLYWKWFKSAVIANESDSYNIKDLLWKKSTCTLYSRRAKITPMTDDGFCRFYFLTKPSNERGIWINEYSPSWLCLVVVALCYFTSLDINVGVVVELASLLQLAAFWASFLAPV